MIHLTPFRQALCIAALLLCCVHSLDASRQRRLEKEAPFLPYINTHYTGSQTLLNEQTFIVPKKERVEVLSADETNTFFRVMLSDGSEGYIPIFCFSAGRITRSFKEDIKYFVNGAQQGDKTTHISKLPYGEYFICGMTGWDPSNGPYPQRMELRTKSNALFLIVSTHELFKSIDVDYLSMLYKDFGKIEKEEPAQHPFYFDNGRKNTIANYKGVSREKLEAILGRPDAIISPTHSKMGKWELLYKHICYQNVDDPGSLCYGVVFYIDPDGTVSAARQDACGTISSTKQIKKNKLPVPAGVKAHDYGAKNNKPAAKPDNAPHEKKGVFSSATGIISISLLALLILLLLYYGLREKLLDRGTRKKTTTQVAYFKEKASGDTIELRGIFRRDGSFIDENGDVMEKLPDGSFTPGQGPSRHELFFTLKQNRWE